MLVDSSVISVNTFDKLYSIAISLMTFGGEIGWSYQFDMSFSISEKSSNLLVESMWTGEVFKYFTVSSCSAIRTGIIKNSGCLIGKADFNQIVYWQGIWKVFTCLVFSFKENRIKEVFTRKLFGFMNIFWLWDFQKLMQKEVIKEIVFKVSCPSCRWVL